MKRKIVISIVVVFAGIMVYLTTGFNTSPSASTITDDYIVLAWNDLGMHCANADFSDIVILPPYNNFNAQVIKRGDASAGIKPEVISSGLDVNYSIPGNTYSVGKTNFWDYEDKLFGVNLPPNIGLTGKGLAGSMDVPSGENYYHVEGVPITPFKDNDWVNEAPYQLALIEVMLNGNKIGETQNVMPVSNEINCLSSGCHASTRDMKNRHSDSKNWPQPVLCASCHSSNALGAPGKPGIKSLSEAIHEKHKGKTNDCNKCHPGPNAQCARGVMSNQHNMSCTDCHGSMEQVAASIHEGRRPWLDEPKCGTCHKQFPEESGKLYRNSKGHGGLFCTTCHGSPHAIVPSREENDNLQNFNLQGYAGTLSDCKVCHTTNPTGAGPHGIYAQQEIDVLQNQVINLVPGWNIMSFWVMPDDSNLLNILQPLINEGKLKKVLNESGNVIEDWGNFGSWQNTIGNLKNTEGYKINVTSASTLNVSGTAVKLSYNIPLSAGWNIISWPTSNEQNGMDIFQSLINEGKLKKVMDEAGLVIEDWGSFGGWQNFIGNFKPGKGYKVNVTTDCMLTINNSSTKSDKIVHDLFKSNHFIHGYKGYGTDHMNINLINVTDSGMMEGDEIGVFDGNICVGSARIVNLYSQINRTSISIPVSAADGIELNNGYIEGNPIVLKLFRDGVEYPLAIEPLNNGTLVFKKGSSLFAKVDIATGLEELNQGYLAEIKCYPNPFSEFVTMELNLDSDANVQVQVLNQIGQKVAVVSPKQIRFSGSHKFTWNGRNENNHQLSSGIYFFRIDVDDSILHKKIILSR